MPKKTWVETLIDDESDAVNDYMELSNMFKAMNKRKFSKLVEKIAQDEDRHRKILISIFKELKNAG